MSRPLRVLIVEDNPADAELILRELRRAGFDPQWDRVDSESEFLARLQPRLDIVLSDFAMPHFTGQQALALMQKSGLNLPFIIISGTIGEDLAVQVMREGASDYLLKDRLARLGPAVSLALDKHRLRKENEMAYEAMRQSEHKYRHLFESLSEAAFLIDRTTRRILDANLCAEDLLGRTRTEILGMDELNLFSAEALPATGGKLTTATRKTPRGQWMETEVVTRENKRIPVQISVAPLIFYGRQLVLALMTDITARRQEEEKLRNTARAAGEANRVTGELLNGITRGIRLPANGLNAHWSDDDGRGMPDSYSRLGLLEEAHD